MNTAQTHPAHLAANTIQQLKPNFAPKIGIILGSGLSSLAETLENTTVINYSDLPNFPKPTVDGHSGTLFLGYLSGVPVMCLSGRVHAYEGPSYTDAVKTYMRTMRLLGCEYFLGTNASGSLHETMKPGELMLLTDHINMQGTNPLIGPNDDEFGPRFFALDEAYNNTMRELFLDIAKQEAITLHQGTYIGVLGPNYETAAEINAFRLMGADAVGMSTIPEVLVAVHCGLKVAVIASISNYATGLAQTSHSHDSVLQVAAQASTNLQRLVERFVAQL